MNEDIDILVLKFLAGDLSESEKAVVETLVDSEEWKSRVEVYRRLESDLDKTAFLDRQRAAMQSYGKGSSNRWVLYAGIGLAACVVIGFLVFKPAKKDQQYASHQTKEATEGEVEEAVGEEDVMYDTEIPEESAYEAFIRSDKDITRNGSVFIFGTGNGAFKRLRDQIDSTSTGILSAIVQYGSVDSVYVFSRMLNGVRFDKHLRFVGQTEAYAVFNLVSYNPEDGSAQKSILLTDKNLNYYGRYIVSSVDDLPDSALPIGLLYEVFDPHTHKWSMKIVSFTEEECIDLPSGLASCISYY